MRSVKIIGKKFDINSWIVYNIGGVAKEGIYEIKTKDRNTVLK